MRYDFHELKHIYCVCVSFLSRMICVLQSNKGFGPQNTEKYIYTYSVPTGNMHKITR